MSERTLCNRRTVLKGIGGVTAATVGASGLTSAYHDSWLNYGEFSINVWRTDQAPHYQDWQDAISDFVTTYTNYFESRGADSCYWHSWYWDDNSPLPLGGDYPTESNVRDAMAEGGYDRFDADGNINIVLTHQNTNSLGACMDDDPRSGGSIIYLNQYHPDIGDWFPLPNRWMKPMLAHECGHLPTGKTPEEEHQNGWQDNVIYNDEVEASAMAAPYTMGNGDTNWVNCDGEMWKGTAPQNVIPWYNYSECTDRYIANYLAGNPGSGRINLNDF